MENSDDSVVKPAETAGLVSVVIPAFNIERFVKEAIDSVLKQTYAHREIIVVDDGSTDNTVPILETYDDRIRIFSQRNSGAGAARNRGIVEARGEYVAFLDGDDTWFPDKLQTQVDLLEKHKEVGLTCGLYQCVDEGGSEVDEDGPPKGTLYDRPIGLYDELLLKGNPVWTSSVVVRASSLAETGPFDQTLRRSQDYDMWIRLAEKNAFYIMSKKLGTYRLVRTSLTHGSVRAEYEAQLRVLEKHIGRFQTGQYRKRISSLYLDWAESEFCYGTVRGGTAACIRSAKLRPLNHRVYSLLFLSLMKRPIKRLLRHNSKLYGEG